MPEIVFLVPGTSSHVRPLLAHFGDRAVCETNLEPEAVAAHKPDLVITVDERQPDRAVCVAEMARRGVATLQIMDGILEWRNTWAYYKGPTVRPFNQPVIAHKVACLGQIDARILESWGNVGKCEIVGSPRFDRLVQMGNEMRLTGVEGRPMRLLVMTAKTPGFTPKQVEIILRALENLRDYLERRSDIEVVWRITEGLHKRLQVKNTFTSTGGSELYDLLAKMDAVVTTPSTTMLESMLFGLPVAVLDYHNTPVYVPSAWRIPGKDQIQPVLEDLRCPPLERMLYQDFCLHQALACRTPALPRMIRLIEDMITIRRQQIAAGAIDLAFPHCILDDPEVYVAWPHEKFDLQALYPDHPVFGRRDLTSLQVELDTALAAVTNLKKQVDILTERLHKIPGYLLLVNASKSLQKWLS